MFSFLLQGLPNVTPDCSSQKDKEIITIEDQDLSEDDKVNEYLDDIERKLEADIKKGTQSKGKDDWKLVDYFKDIICVKEVNVPNKTGKAIEIANKKSECKRRRKNCDLPPRISQTKKRRTNASITLSDGEIISEEEIILSDFSLSPEQGQRNDKFKELKRRDIDLLKNGPKEESRKYTKNDRSEYRHRGKLKEKSFDGSDHSSLLHKREEKKRIVHVVPESSTSRNAEHHRQSHRTDTHCRSEHRRRHCSPEIHHEENRKRATDHSKSKRHCKCENKREGKSKSSSDYFDENKYHGSDKSRIRNLKKKYNEYLKYAKKYKNDNEDNKHIEKFAKMRSKMKGEDLGSKQIISSDETSSIDYKKEEEKFLRSLETYLEIKKKQEKSITNVAQLPLISTSNKEYNPDISSEEEEYVPEKFTPEDMSVSNVEEYDPCSVSNISDSSFTYKPTKIDEYEPIILQIDEEYCPMPVEKTLQLTYNPTKKFSNNIPTQAAISKQHAQGWIKTAIQCPTIHKHLIPHSMKKQPNVKIMNNKPRRKVISKNTVFIGNIVNPFALNDKSKVVSCKKLNAPSTSKSVDKSKIMSKLLHEKLMEIEKKKLQLLEEINRKKLLKIKEKCDEVALRNLELKKSDLMMELYRNTKTEVKLNDDVLNDSESINSDSSKNSILPGKINHPAQENSESVILSNKEIKKEKNDPNLPADNIREKLSALQKRKADLMLEINKKLSVNSERMNKEKAEVASKLEVLEKNKSSLFAQVIRKEEEEKSVTIKKEKEDIHASTMMDSITERTLLIDEKKEIKNEIPKMKNIEVNKKLENTNKKIPAINEKLKQLEQEKTKLMAQIAAKSNQTGIVVHKEQPKLKVNKPEEVNEKLVMLAKKKEELLLQIEKKKIHTESQLSKSDSTTSTCLINQIKKERDENPAIFPPNKSLKEKEDHVNVAVLPNVVIKQEPKENPNHLLSSNNLALKINELEKQKAHLMQTLAKKLPGNEGIKVDSKDITKETVKKSGVHNAGIIKTNPVAVVELASQVKLKVSQQLSEITKKKMELIRQINSKSLNTTEATETSKNSSKLSCSSVSPNVQDKLLEIEKNKLQLLVEIKAKSNQNKYDKENIVERKQEECNADVTKKASTSNLSKVYDNEETVNVHTFHDHKKDLECALVSDSQFKIPEIPRLKNRKKGHKNKNITSKTRKQKYQKSKIKTMLSQKKISMLKKFRKMNTLKRLWTNSDNAVLIPNKDSQNKCTVESTNIEVQALNEHRISHQFNKQNAENSGSNNLSSSTFSIQELPGSLKVDVINKPIEQTDDTSDEVEVLQTCPTVSEQIDMITIDDDDDDHCQSKKHSTTNENAVIIKENLDFEEEVVNDEFITLKVIKVEKPWNFGDKENKENDENIDDGRENSTQFGNENMDSTEFNQSNEDNGNIEHTEHTIDKTKHVINDPVQDDSNISIKLLSFDINGVKKLDGLKKNNSVLISDYNSLDNTQDVVFVRKKILNRDDLTSNFKKNSKLISSSLKKNTKNSPTSTVNTPAIAKLILNNRRKLISANSQYKKNNNNLKLSTNTTKLSVVRVVHSKPLPGKKSKLTMERLVNLNCYTRKKRFDNRVFQNPSIHQAKKCGSLIEKKLQKSPLLYKFVKDHFNSSNISKYKLTNNNDGNITIKPNSSKISKFKLVHGFDNTPNIKLNNYKNLPPVIRRAVINRFKLNNTITPIKTYRYSTCNKKSIRQLGRSKFNVLKSVGKSNPCNSEKVSTLRKNSKSKYKVCRVILGNDSSARKTQEEILKSTNKIPRGSNTSRKYHANNKVTQRCVTTKPSQLKINHLVSKYKMIRFSNQRERNKINLSQRLQESSYPNRTMYVKKLISMIFFLLKL